MISFIKLRGKNKGTNSDTNNTVNSENKKYSSIKKIPTSIAVAALLLTSTVAIDTVNIEVQAETQVNKNAFIDVPVSNDFYSYIHQLANEDIMSGYENGLYFKPNNPLTRGQMVKMFVGVLESYKIKSSFSHPEKQFVDTKGTSFDYYASMSYRYGLVEGYGDYFKPYNNATRGQVAKLIVETFGFEKQGNCNPYKDSIDTPFADYIQVLYEQGITDAPTNFNPYANITRAQFSKFLAISLNKWLEKNNVNVDYVSGTNTEEVSGRSNSEIKKEVEEKVSNFMLNIQQNGEGLTSKITIEPKSQLTPSQIEMAGIKGEISVHNGQLTILNMPYGEYSIKVRSFDGKDYTVVQGIDFTVNSSEMTHVVRVAETTEDTSSTKVDDSSTKVNDTVNTTPTKVDNSSVDSQQAVKNVTLKWQFVDENGQAVEGLSFKVTPSVYEGVDVQTLQKMRSVKTDANGEISFENVLNDRTYTLTGTSFYDVNGFSYEKIEDDVVTSEIITSEVKDDTITRKITLTKKVVPSVNYPELFKQEFARLLNEERKAKGLNELQYHDTLNQLAKTRSQYMADNNHFAHEVVGGSEDHIRLLLMDMGLSKNEVGNLSENILRTLYDGDSNTAEFAFERWKNSEGHYRSMLYDDHVYMGLDFAIKDDEIYFTFVSSPELPIMNQ